jgi:small subunit ribosomal protein S16
MLSIRLRRAGTTKKPHYRVVVADSRCWRDGRFVEILGHYDPRTDPGTISIDTTRAEYWISKGARPSDTVRSLLKKGNNAAALKPYVKKAQPSAEAK